MRVHELQKIARPNLVTCGPHERLRDVAALLAEERIGALPVVTPQGHLIGIISERDICHALADFAERTANLTVADIMTREVATCEPRDLVQEVISKMSYRGIRHLPVLEDGRLVGVISMRDVLEATLREARLEASIMRDYARTLAC